MPSPLRRASPLSKRGGTASTTSTSVASPRNHHRPQKKHHPPRHHNTTITTNNHQYSSPTKFPLSSKRGGGASHGTNSSSNHRAGTFYILLLFSLPLVLVWQYWIFWYNDQNHFFYPENQYEQQQQQPPPSSNPATSPLALLLNQPRIQHTHGSSRLQMSTATSSSRASASAVGRQSRISPSTTRASKSASSTIRDYDHSRFPILSIDVYDDPSNPVSVIFVDRTTVMVSTATSASITAAQQLSPSRSSNQTRSLLLQGLERSRSIRLVTAGPDDHDAAASSRLLRVHFVDWASLNRDCHLLERYYYNRYNYQYHPSPTSTFFFSDHHVLVYYDASASARVVTCPRVNALFGTGTAGPGRNSNVRIVKQAIVVDRHWDPQLQWIVPGCIAENNISGRLPLDDMQTTTTTRSQSGYPILHAAVFLRDSFVAMMDDVLEKEQGSDNVYSSIRIGSLAGNWSTFSTMLANRERKLDLAIHLRKDDYARYSFLRRRVGQEVVLLGNNANHPYKNSTYSLTGSSVIQEHTNLHNEGSRSLRTLVRIMGDENEMESSGGEPQAEYVLSLLTTKIVIVAQHDEWEDHERLLQAMASGAMVMTDSMLAPPPGIQNGTNVVIYDSASSLVRLALHYLHPKQTKERIKIAQRGCQLAFDEHRSWHRMEQVLFGTTKGKAGQLLESSLSSFITKQ